MPTVESGRKTVKRGPLAGISWGLSTPNTVVVIAIVAVGLLIAMRQGFRPVNLG